MNPRERRCVANRGVVRAAAELERLVRSRMADQGLSVRGLARRAGVSHSAVSRLLRGSARPTTGLLSALAPALALPPEDLLRAAGLAAGGEPSVWTALRGMGVDPAPPELVASVRAELRRLREYAATEEAPALVREGLERKIAALGARGPVIDRLRALAELYLDAGGLVAPAARWAAGAAVLYFLTATDAIDDFIFPIGYIDDAVAVALAEAEVGGLGDGPPGA